MSDADVLLRRLERTALVACVGMTIVAALVGPRRVESAAGVLAGGALAAASYRGIKMGIDATAMAGGGQDGRRAAVGLVKFFTRYAILAVAAYVMIVRLRLPPVPIVAGASSFVVAVALEALRGIADRRPRRPIDGQRSVAAGSPRDTQWKNSSTNSGSSSR